MTIREWLARHPEVNREQVEIQANYGDSFWTMTEDDYDEDIDITDDIQYSADLVTL